MRGAIFEYMTIAEVWAEFYGTKKSAAALTLYYSIINTANRNQWKEWVLLNYDHLTRILVVSEKTIKAYLDLLADPEFGIIEKDFDFRNKGKIAIRLKSKTELEWVNIQSNRDYEYLKNPPSFQGKVNIKTEPELNPSKNKKTKKEKTIKSINKKDIISNDAEESGIEFNYDPLDQSGEFKFNDWTKFVNKPYESFPDEVKNTITREEFEGYIVFYKKFGVRYFNNEKYVHNVTPFDYKKHIHHLSEAQIQGAIDKIVSSAGFYPAGNIASRISNALSWKTNNNSVSNTPPITINNSSYVMDSVSISRMNVTERERVKRTMYQIIQSCTTISNLETALSAKKVLEAYKINGEITIDSSTNDHSNSIINKLLNLKKTHDFIKTKTEDLIKEFISIRITEVEKFNAYFKYCYATHINQFHLHFTYNIIIEELYKIESIDSDEKLVTKTTEVIERVIESMMKDKGYKKQKLFAYNLDDIYKDEEFMSIWKLHITSITPKTTNFKLK